MVALANETGQGPIFSYLGYRWRAGTAPSVCTIGTMKSSAGKQCRNTWAPISVQVVLFHPQSFWLTKGLKKAKRKHTLCSVSTFSPGFLIKDDFIVWLPIKIFVFLSSLSLGSVAMLHHFSILVPLIFI